MAVRDMTLIIFVSSRATLRPPKVVADFSHDAWMFLQTTLKLRSLGVFLKKENLEDLTSNPESRMKNPRPLFRGDSLLPPFTVLVNFSHPTALTYGLLGHPIQNGNPWDEKNLGHLKVWGGLKLTSTVNA